VTIDTTTDLDGRVAAAHRRYATARPRSAALDVRARRVLPGGNTRSVLDFAPFPFRVASASAAELVDVDGHRYLDLCGNYTAGLLGHSPTVVRDAVVAALERGWALGAVHEAETELAELVCERFPTIDQVRFTNSGTEANLMAIGTALHHTGRRTVGVFDHAYHGGVLAFGTGTDGPHHPLNVPHRFHVAPFDDVGGLDALFADGDLGCVLVEAVQGSGGCRPASAEFLHELRSRCDAHGVVLVFDEVMTSRLAPGGAQDLFGIRADMTTLGKYLGGGFTFGAFGGRRDIMAAFDPNAGGGLTQAGTFNNNVASMAAAVATLRHELTSDRIIEVNRRGDRLRDELDAALDTPGLWVTGLGSMNSFHAGDDRRLDLLFHDLLDDGVYVARRGFMALSMEITDEHCDRVVASVRRHVESSAHADERAT
jgi:glutamate-1-semialdehyde 2,1-aminomutase